MVLLEYGTTVSGVAVLHACFAGGVRPASANTRFPQRRDNELVWILAPHRGWGRAGVDSSGHETADFLLTAVDSNGTPFSAAVQDGGTAAIIDESSGTVRQVWQYGEERGDPCYSSIISDVDFLPDTENRLIMPGIVTAPDSRAYVTEVSYPDAAVVFEGAIRFRNEIGNGTLDWGRVRHGLTIGAVAAVPGLNRRRSRRGDNGSCFERRSRSQRTMMRALMNGCGVQWYGNEPASLNV